MTTLLRVAAATVLSCIAIACTKTRSDAQTPRQPATATAARDTSVPATKLEAFRPSAGSVTTFGYNDVGRVGRVSVDARELRGSKGEAVRGIVVEITESEYREERSFIDQDEIAELLRGFDAILDVKSNPTRFPKFEVRYTTRGNFEITAYNNQAGRVAYAAKAGRTLTAQAFLDESAMRQLRGYIEAAQSALAAATSRSNP